MRSKHFWVVSNTRSTYCFQCGATHDEVIQFDECPAAPQKESPLSEPKQCSWCGHDKLNEKVGGWLCEKCSKFHVRNRVQVTLAPTDTTVSQGHTDLDYKNGVPFDAADEASYQIRIEKLQASLQAKEVELEKLKETIAQNEAGIKHLKIQRTALENRVHSYESVNWSKWNEDDWISLETRATAAEERLAVATQALEEIVGIDEGVWAEHPESKGTHSYHGEIARAALKSIREGRKDAE